MFDLRWLTENFDLVQKKTALRKAEVDFDAICALIKRRRDVIHAAETARFEQREAQQGMRKLDKQSDEFRELRAHCKGMAAQCKQLEEEKKQLVRDLDERLLWIPNIIDDGAPLGEDDSKNELLRTVGTPKSFEFEVKDHAELGEASKTLDFERGAKVSGSRFTFLRGKAAKLNRALISFMLDLHVDTHGYEELLPPFLVLGEAMLGTGQLPKFAEDAFRTGDHYLVPTAEVPVTNFHTQEILNEDVLPRKYAAYTPCFRREAGSYGADTRGMFRQHQFDKVELVWMVHPDRSDETHAELVGHATRVLELLELPYRVVNLCSGDIGFSAALCHDIEVWLPHQKQYREISSCSNFRDFQARRANIRFRPSDGGNLQFVHTLNGSGLALGRTIIAIMENYQNADGSITVPEVLRDRMGCDRF